MQVWLRRSSDRQASAMMNGIGLENENYLYVSSLFWGDETPMLPRPIAETDHVPHFLLDTGGAGMVVYRHAGLRSRFFGRNHLENRGDGGI